MQHRLIKGNKGNEYRNRCFRSNQSKTLLIYNNTLDYDEICAIT